MAAHRKLDRRRVYLCAVGHRKRAYIRQSDLQHGYVQRSQLSSGRDHLADGHSNRVQPDPERRLGKKERATEADCHFLEKPIHLTDAEGCAPEQKVETGWLLAKALRAHPEAVWQLVRAR